MVRKFLPIMLVLVMFLTSIFSSEMILAMGRRPEDAPKVTGTAGARAVDKEEEEEKKEIKTDIEEEEMVITEAELEEFLKEGGLGRWRK